MALGAPPELVASSNRDALDEIRHTELSSSLARELDGEAEGPGAFPAAQTARTLPPTRTLALAALAVDSLVDGALHEGISARVVARLAKRCEVPRIRAMLKEIAADEGRHAAHGWDVVEFCLAESSALRRARARRRRRQAPALKLVTPMSVDAASGGVGDARVARPRPRGRGLAATRASLVKRLDRLLARSSPAPRGQPRFLHGRRTPAPSKRRQNRRSEVSGVACWTMIEVAARRRPRRLCRPSQSWIDGRLAAAHRQEHLAFVGRGVDPKGHVRFAADERERERVAGAAHTEPLAQLVYATAGGARGRGASAGRAGRRESSAGLVGSFDAAPTTRGRRRAAVLLPARPAHRRRPIAARGPRASSPAASASAEKANRPRAHSVLQIGDERRAIVLRELRSSCPCDRRSSR